MRRDAVTTDLHAEILLRDRECVLAKLYSDHVCRDQWGLPHRSDDLGRLTLEHVHDGYGLMGRRAPSDRHHLVAMCGGANVGVPSKAERAAIRAYLVEVNR
jgi:hypothetical protein